MAGMTAEQVQERLDNYIAAETAVLKRQSYAIAGRQMTLADLSEIRKGIADCQSLLSTLTLRAQGRGRSRVIVPGF